MDEVQPEENEEFSPAMDFQIQRADELTDVPVDDKENIEENTEDDTESDAEEEEVPPFQLEKAQRQPSKNPKSSEAEIQNGIVSIQHEISQKEAAEKKEYRFPPLKPAEKRQRKIPGRYGCPSAENCPEAAGGSSQFRSKCDSDKCKLWSYCNSV